MPGYIHHSTVAALVGWTAAFGLLLPVQPVLLVLLWWMVTGQDDCMRAGEASDALCMPLQAAGPYSRSPVALQVTRPRLSSPCLQSVVANRMAWHVMWHGRVLPKHSMGMWLCCNMRR
jgi:hypothetical protein